MINPRFYLISAAAILGGTLSFTIASGHTDATPVVASDPRNFNSYYAPAYQLPDPATMSASAARGKELVNSTYRLLGAESGNRAANGRPFVGNKLNCSNCHMADGTQPDASPFVVVAQKYAPPGIFNARSNIFLDVANRVNTCMERSLAGEMLPLDSQWMKDFVSYFDFLSTGLQPGFTFEQVRGLEFPDVPLLTRAANPERGKDIYGKNCAKCHKSNGNGRWLDDQQRFLFPAVWGEDSFGLMSGAGRLATLVTLVWGTMPRDKVDVMDPTTRLLQQDAWDVSAYLLSNERPFNRRHIADWTGVGPDGMPNWLRRPADASYDFTMPRVANDGSATDDPNRPPMFPRRQHTFGPFQPIQAELKKARNLRGFP